MAFPLLVTNRAKAESNCTEEYLSQFLSCYHLEYLTLSVADVSLGAKGQFCITGRKSAGRGSFVFAQPDAYPQLPAFLVTMNMS